MPFGRSNSHENQLSQEFSTFPKEQKRKARAIAVASSQLLSHRMKLSMGSWPGPFSEGFAHPAKDTLSKDWTGATNAFSILDGPATP